MYKLFALTLALGLPLACGGTSESNDAKGSGAGQSGHGSAGHGGSGAAGSGGSGGSGASGGATGGAGKAQGGAGAGSGAAGAGIGGATGGAGKAQGGAGAGSGGEGAGIGGAAGESGAGAGGSAGNGGNGGSGGKVCGGRTGMACDSGQYCAYESHMCGSADETGICTTQPGGIACVQGFVCGCDGNVYTNLCMAHLSGVDTWAGSQCIPGDGMAGDACLVDDDCSSGLKCCSSPIQIISCTAPMGTGCPLTP